MAGRREAKEHMRLLKGEVVVVMVSFVVASFVVVLEVIEGWSFCCG